MQFNSFTPKSYSGETKRKLLIAAIDNPLDEPQVRRLISDSLSDYLTRLAEGESPDALRAELVPERGDLRRILAQPNLNLIHATQALDAARRRQSIRVAVLADSDSAGLQELQQRVTYSRLLATPANPRTESGHTSAVLTLIAALAPSAQFVLLGVMSDGGARLSDIHQGVQEAVLSEARIVVMPFGTPSLSAGTPSFSAELFDRFFSLPDVLYIASAGIRGTSEKIYPAALPDVLAVGTTDATDARAAFSNYGTWIDLVAPGVDIETLTPDGQIQVASGGIYSTAIVSGVAALVWSIRPDLRAEDIANILKSAAVSVASQNPDLRDLLGAGRLDALESVRAAVRYERLDP